MTAFNEAFLPIFKTVGTVAGIGLASKAAGKTITNNVTKEVKHYDISDKVKHLRNLRNGSSTY